MLDINQIFNCDCLDGLELLDDESVDLIVTSPPYYNAREYASWNTYTDYLGFISLVLTECGRVLKKGGFICWNVSPRIVVNNKKYSLGYDTQNILENVCSELSFENGEPTPIFTYYDNLIWLKPKGGYRLSFAETKWQSMSKKGDRPVRLMPRYENIFIYSKGDPFTCRLMVEPETRDFWYWGNVCDLPVDHLPGHNGVFPLELPKQMINWFMTSSKGLVCDPFSGRGTSCLASKELGHNYIGFEINKDFITYSERYLNGDSGSGIISSGDNLDIDLQV